MTKRTTDLKPHIGIYGRRNAGKSSLINHLSGTDLAIVSNIAGTTTDPVKKTMEITGIGPVIVIDTAGIDDNQATIGDLRVKKTMQTIANIDFAIVIITHNIWGGFEQLIVDELNRYKTPFMVLHNKADLQPYNPNLLDIHKHVAVMDYATTNTRDKESLIKKLRLLIPESAYQTPSLIGNLISYGDIVLLITPIDIEAPHGRMILPQVQMIRDILDNDAVAIVLKEREVDTFLKKTNIKPALAITDSQIFLKADASVPKDIPLTGFSVVLAHLKGDFQHYLKGTPKIADLQENDRILLLESCTHHVSCDDIGRVKIPRWISNFTGKKLHFDLVAGLDTLKRPITDYALVIQCGGCVITRKQLSNRLLPALEAGVPVTNYGMAIAYVQGIYQRAIEPFVKLKQNETDYL